MIAPVQRKVLEREFGQFLQASKVPNVRTITQFAKDEIWLPPGGPFAGQKFDFERQPWALHWCALIDSGLYSRFALVKPGQVGGTLMGFNLPLMYHIFERRENTGCGVVSMDMAWDKWCDDIRPIIEASQYRDLIPAEGRGSKGGKFTGITFKNGVSLRFMTPGGNDKTRAGKTLRALVLTEVDGYDEVRETSREGDPISQMEGRLNAFALIASRVYLECTVSIETGRIWKEYKNGTQSILRLQCPHCRHYVELERKDLKGWQTAQTELEAIKNTLFHCPDCSLPWSEDQRKYANHHAVLVHRGQEVTPEGQVIGERPQTITATLRVSAVHNLLRPAGDVGWKEWKAKYAPDNEESNLKSIYQFVFVIPWAGESNATGINEEIVASRLTGLKRYELPEDTETLVVHIDLHLKWHYWTVCAAARNVNPFWKPDAKTLDGKPIPQFMPAHYSIVDYGLRWNPDRKRLGPEGALEAGLEQLAEELESIDFLTEGGRSVPLDLGTIDGGFHPEIGIRFCISSGGIWRVMSGIGRKDSRGKHRYEQPKKRTKDVRPGDHWFDQRQPACPESNGQHWWRLYSDTNYWMHQVHAGFIALPWIDDKGDMPLPPGVERMRRPGSIALFGDDPEEHHRLVDAMVPRSTFATQIVGWIWSETKTKKKGQQIGWNSQWNEDHWFDTTYQTLPGHSVVRAYARRFRPKPPPPQQRPAAERFTTPDGRPYLLTDR